MSLSSVSTINLKDVSFDKTPKNREEVISNTGLCLFYSCLFLFFFSLYNVFCNLYIIYVLILENQSTELGIWLNDLNSNSILCQTISDVSIDKNI